MIVKGNPAKRYKPGELRNLIRRGMKLEMERHFKQLPYKSKAVDLLMGIPGLLKVMNSLIHAGTKIIDYVEKKQLTKEPRKVELSRETLSMERRNIGHDITISK